MDQKDMLFVGCVLGVCLVSVIAIENVKAQKAKEVRNKLTRKMNSIMTHIEFDIIAEEAFSKYD